MKKKDYVNKSEFITWISIYGILILIIMGAVILQDSSNQRLNLTDQGLVRDSPVYIKESCAESHVESSYELIPNQSAVLSCMKECPNKNGIIMCQIDWNVGVLQMEINHNKCVKEKDCLLNCDQIKPEVVQVNKTICTLNKIETFKNVEAYEIKESPPYLFKIWRKSADDTFETE